MLSNIKLKDSSDFAYLSSVIKSKEKQLLSDGDFAEMNEVDFSKFFSILVEKGYHLHDEKENLSFEKIYEWELWHLYKLLEELISISNLNYLSPLFYLQNECINLKIIGKKVLFFENNEKSISTEDLANLPLTQYSLHNKNQILLFYKDFLNSNNFFEKYIEDTILNDLAQKLIKLGIDNLTALKLDILIDKFYFEQINKIVKRSNSELLLIFYDLFSGLINLKNILRLFFEKKEFYDFQPFYIESKIISKQVSSYLMENKFEKTGQLFVENPFSTEIMDIINFTLKDKNLSLLEKWIDDQLTLLLQENMKSAFFNFENLLSYKWAKEIELKNIKIIYIGKKNNLPKDLIEKLIRKSYVRENRGF